MKVTVTFHGSFEVEMTDEKYAAMNTDDEMEIDEWENSIITPGFTDRVEIDDYYPTHPAKVRS
jgi:hypothetical protein